MNQKVLVLGSATRNGTCTEGICDGNTIYGDKKVMEFNRNTNSWIRTADMTGKKAFICIYIFNAKFLELRLAYTTTLELPRRVCETFSATPRPDTDSNLEIQNSAKEDS